MNMKFDFDYKPKEQSYPVLQTYVPETLDFCRKHYIPPVQKYISCDCFGNNDGTDGSCHWCLEMTPYQWWMCSDAQDVQSAMNNYNLFYEDAIRFVETKKSMRSE